MIIKSTEAVTRKKSAVFALEQLAVPEWAEFRQYWKLIDHVLAGELTVKNHADKYIYRPMSKRGNTTEAWMSWEAYKNRGKLPKIAAENLEKMQGTICARPPLFTLEPSASRLEFFREKATPFSDGLDALFSRTVENVLKYGRYCLLLEPDEDGDIFHINEFRPEKLLRVVPIEKGGDSYAKVVYLDTSNIRFDYHLHQDVYCPQITILALDGRGVYYQAKFGTGEVPLKGLKDGAPVPEDAGQYKDTMGEVFAELESFDIDNPDPGRAIYPTKFGKTLDRIPFTVVSPNSLNFMRFAAPPLLDLCVQSLHILNADCDHQQAIYLTTDPIPKFTKLEKTRDGAKVMLSADRSLILGGEADFNFVSAPTGGLQMQADNIERMLAESRQMGLNITGTDGAANTSGVALEIIRNAQTAKLRMVNQFCAKAIEEQLRRAAVWLLNMAPEAVAENVKYTPSADLAKVKPTMTELSAFANVAEKFSVTRRELREWLEENFDIEHKDWDDLQAELDAERDLAEIGTGFDIPPVVNEDDPSGEDDKNAPKNKIGFNDGSEEDSDQ